jgi:uncharacterized protein with NRDE domain
MCLAVIALGVHPCYSLVVAANRDEFHARPARPAHWGTEAPFAQILAGRDLAAGGTWLGVRRDARWALLTNVRGSGKFDPDAPSRGSLVPTILNDPRPATKQLSALATSATAAHGRAYNGFNLLAGDANSAVWMSNRAPTLQTLAGGIHGLSNALLDTPWPKLLRAKDALAAWATYGGEDFSPLFDALGDRAPAPDDALPATGIPLERERLLSSPFIVSERYGTRCSTVFAVGHSGHARLIERTFDARGAMTGEVAFEFAVEKS